MLSTNGHLQAPPGGLRIDGVNYHGGDPVPEKYRKQIEASTRPRDPAHGFAQVPSNFSRAIMPEIITYRGRVTSLSRSFRFSDEALRHSLENAHAMINDPTITIPLLARKRMTALLPWHIETEDDRHPKLKALGRDLTAILKRTPRMTEYMMSLLNAIWYGRYANQNVFGHHTNRFGMRHTVIKKWKPVSGDKLLFRYDDGSEEYDPDGVGVLVSPALSRRDDISGTRRLEATADGLGYFLEPWERSRFAIHKHLVWDGDFEDPISAGKVHGVGLRSFLYWVWFQKQEALAQLSEIVEKTGLGFQLYYYPSGNVAARDEMKRIAEEQSHTNILLIPHDTADPDSHRVDIIPANTAGMDGLSDLIIKHFNAQITKLILGQTLSQDAEATGLGSGVADLHEKSLHWIIRYDSVNLEETMTTEVLNNLLRYNFPAYQNVSCFFKINTSSANPKENLEAAKMMFDMGASLKTEDLYKLTGMSQPGPSDDVLKMPEQQPGMGGIPGQPPGQPGQPGQQLALPFDGGNGNANGNTNGGEPGDLIQAEGPPAIDAQENQRTAGGMDARVELYQYVDMSPNPQQICFNCKHAAADGNQCLFFQDQRLDPTVDPMGWCNAWEPEGPTKYKHFGEGTDFGLRTPQSAIDVSLPPSRGFTDGPAMNAGTVMAEANDPQAIPGPPYMGQHQGLRQGLPHPQQYDSQCGAGKKGAPGFEGKNTCNPALRREVQQSFLGSDASEEDIGGVTGAMREMHGQRQEQTIQFNTQLNELLGQFGLGKLNPQTGTPEVEMREGGKRKTRSENGRKAAAFFRQVERAEDPTHIPKFDEMVEMAKRSSAEGGMAELINPGSGESDVGDAEEGLFNVLKQGAARSDRLTSEENVQATSDWLTAQGWTVEGSGQRQSEPEGADPFDDPFESPVPFSRDRADVLRYASQCGAGDEGNQGFQAGNTCAGEGGGDEGEQQGGERSIFDPRHNAFFQVTEQLPPDARMRIQDSLDSAMFYDTPQELMEDVLGPERSNELLQSGQQALGVYRSSTGELFMDGANEENTQQDVIAHEVSHALDNGISDTEQWQAAFDAEINQAGTPLSAYASSSPREGFAEFGRLAYTNPREASTKFPMSWSVWEQNGLVNPVTQAEEVPTPMEGQSLEERFSHSVELEDGHADIDIEGSAAATGGGGTFDAEAARQAEQTVAAARAGGQPSPGQTPGEATGEQQQPQPQQPQPQPAQPQQPAGGAQGQPQGAPGQQPEQAHLPFGESIVANMFGLDMVKAMNPEGTRKFLNDTAQKTGFTPDPNLSPEENSAAAAQHLQNQVAGMKDFLGQAKDVLGYRPRSGTALPDAMQEAGVKIMEEAAAQGYPVDVSSLTEENLRDQAQDAMEFIAKQQQGPLAGFLNPQTIGAIVSLLAAAYVIRQISRGLRGISRLAMNSP